jgi:hypothetical protein
MQVVISRLDLLQHQIMHQHLLVYPIQDRLLIGILLLGANAAITLTQNSTLSFSATPLVGSYGTVVLTQDGTGNRTITLPTIVGVTNKVLGSSSETSIALSTSASAKDILNFYYDGTNCYWNIGQGYGSAATAALTLTTTGTGAATLSGTTLNIPSVSSTVNAGSISGTIAVAQWRNRSNKLNRLCERNWHNSNDS